MEKILVSACLLGDKTRYDGESNKFAFLDELGKKYELVPFCPEVEAGLGIPRSPAEIVRNEVINKDGANLTKQYNESAEKAYRICLFLGIKIAILKDGSPACGSRKIHNGRFDGGKIDGLGVTARYLIAKNIKVYCENDNLEFLLKEKTEKKKRSPIKKEENRYSAKAISKGEESEKSFDKSSRFSKRGSFSKSEKRGPHFERGAKKGYSSSGKGYGSKNSWKQGGSSYRKNDASSHKDSDKAYYEKKDRPFRKDGERKNYDSSSKKSFRPSKYNGKRNSSGASYKNKRDSSSSYKRNGSSSYKGKKRASFKKEG